MEALGLRDAKPATSPAEEKKDHEEGDEVELDAESSTKFRALAARANFLATDRADIQFAVKELCRRMSRPLVGDKKKIKRLGRYLLHKPRMVQEYEWQGRANEIDAFTDSDWAGCARTGKSTSGGVIRVGTHMIKSWCRTQKTVALSSGEAELTAMVKTTCEAIGISALMKDWGDEKEVLVFADSNAALGIMQRKGAGKLRHVRIGMLWLQDAKEEGIRFNKVPGGENPADLMTKALSGKSIEEHCKRLKIKHKAGRAEKASKLSRGVNSFALVKRFVEKC